MSIDFRALLREENTLRWEFLESEADACAVVTTRMELVYLNRPCQTLVPVDWFAKRCFEVLPHNEALCAMECPTIAAVQTADELRYTEERLTLEDGSLATLGTAVIPLREDGGRNGAILLFRTKPPGVDARAFEAALLSDAGTLHERAST